MVAERRLPHPVTHLATHLILQDGTVGFMRVKNNTPVQGSVQRSWEDYMRHGDGEIKNE